jgi:NADH-quinone oxidoreductase subunit G
VRALSEDGALILAGERLATSPGALSAVAALGVRTGARVAWIPRRPGERGAIDAGALPNLLPGGRLVADETARTFAGDLWGEVLPKDAGRDVDEMLQAACDGSLAALVVGGVDPADFGDPAIAKEAFERAGFIVSLEVRHSAVTEHADVVLPVAPPVEKAGRYVTWEGRRRPFDLTIQNTGVMSDGRVLHALAEELDVDLGLASVEAARAELMQFAALETRPAAPDVAPATVDAPETGHALLATWTELLDAGRMQDGDEYLAGTAKTARAILSAATAADVGVVNGGKVSVLTDAGSIVVPVVVDDGIADGVVWLPTNARGCAVRATLNVAPGSAVKLTNADAPPVIGMGGDAS